MASLMLSELSSTPVKASKTYIMGKSLILQYGNPPWKGSLSKYTTVTIDDGYRYPVDFSSGVNLYRIIVASDKYNHPINLSKTVNLEALIISSDDFNQELNLSKAPHLDRLHIRGGFNQPLNTGHNTKLTELSIIGEYAHPINLDRNRELLNLNLDCQSNHLLELYSNEALTDLTVMGAYNKKLDIFNNINLVDVTVGGPDGKFNGVIEFDLEDTYNDLTNFRIGGKFNRELTLEVIPKLKYLEIGGYYKLPLNLTCNPGLRILHIIGNSFKNVNGDVYHENDGDTELDLTANLELEELYVEPAMRYHIDLSQNYNLKGLKLNALHRDIDLRNNRGLVDIQISGGNRRNYTRKTMLLPDCFEYNTEVSIDTDHITKHDYECEGEDSDNWVSDSEDSDSTDSEDYTLDEHGYEADRSGSSDSSDSSDMVID